METRLPGDTPKQQQRKDRGEYEPLRGKKPSSGRSRLQIAVWVAVAALIIGLSTTTIIFGIQSAKKRKKKKCSEKEVEAALPNKLVILIGDGMGSVHNRALQLYLGVEETQLDKLFQGRYVTKSSASYVTDSAAGAYAFGHGNVTHNGYIGVDRHGNPTGSLFEAGKQAGKGIGIVTTTRVTHATPATFYAHALIREWESFIAKQMAEKNQESTMLDFVFGGGKRYFMPQGQDGSKRNDDWDFLSTYKDYGWNKLVFNLSQLDELTAEDMPVAGLFSNSHMPYAIDREHPPNGTDWPDLVDMVGVGIELLEQKYADDGWFMMVEAGKVDRCAHDNDIACLMREMVEVEEVLTYLTEFAERDGQTLVVALADHETGGLALGRGTSARADDLVFYQTGIAPKNYDIAQYYGSFDFNYLMPPNDVKNLAFAYIYNWFPEALKNARHSCEFIVDDILLEMNEEAPVTIDDVVRVVEDEYGIAVTPQERNLLNESLYRDPEFGHVDADNLYIEKWAPIMMHSLAMILNARSLTGWSTHGHSGADVMVSAYGPGAEQFRGHFANFEIGRVIRRLVGMEELVQQKTQAWQSVYQENGLKICDDTEPLEYVGWDHNVSYPEGNLLYPGWCVEEYVDPE